MGMKLLMKDVDCSEGWCFYLSVLFVCLFFLPISCSPPTPPLEIWSQARERKNTTEGISYCSDDLESSFPFKGRHQDWSFLTCFHCDETTRYFTVWLGGGGGDEFRSFTVYRAVKNVRQNPGAVLLICHFKSRLVVVTRFIFTLNLYHCKSSTNAQSVASFYDIPHLQHRRLQKHWAKYKKNEKWAMTCFNF